MRDASRNSFKRSTNRRDEKEQQSKLRRSVVSRAIFAPEALENRTLLSSVVVTATDDTYVRPGTSANTNFDEAAGSCALPLAGTSCLVVRNDNGTSSGALARLTYLKFSTAGLIGTVNSASVKLSGLVATGTDTFPGPKNDDLFGVSDTVWTENSINYNNRPAADGGILDTQVIAGSTVKAYLWNVTGWVPAHIGGPIAFM